MSKEYYLWNGIDASLERVESIDEAKKVILEDYTDPSEGIHPDIESLFILERIVNVEVEQEGEYHKVVFKPEPVDKVDTLEEAARIEGVKYIRSLGGSEYSIGSMNDHAVFIAGFKHGASYSEAIVLKALKLAIEIINDVDRYQGSNLVNGEIEKFKEIIQSLKK